MTKIRVFPKNDKGKIEFTKDELQKLLNKVYNEGKIDSYTIYYGSGLTTTVPYSTITTDNASTSISGNNSISTPLTAEVKDY